MMKTCLTKRFIILLAACSLGAAKPTTTPTSPNFDWFSTDGLESSFVLTGSGPQIVIEIEPNADLIIGGDNVKWGCQHGHIRCIKNCGGLNQSYMFHDLLLNCPTCCKE